MSEITKNKKQFQITVIIVTVLIILTRLPFFLYYQVISISFDTASYCAVALNITEGNLPAFEIRTPGYPLFLAMIWFFSKNLFIVAVIQSLITIAVTAFFLHAINKVYAKFLIPFAAALVIYETSSYFILFESVLLAESLFVNLLLLITALLILAIKENRAVYWLYFSISAGLLLYLRPAGLFLVPVMMFVLLYFYKKKFRLVYYANLILPVTIFILALCIYNKATVDSFSMSPFGNINLPGATITFMEKSPEYPQFVNEIIDTVSNSLPSKDRRYVRESFGFTKLYDIFLNNFYAVIVLTDKLIKHDSTGGFISVIPYLKQISFDAVKKHPDIYAKFFISNFVQYFRNISKTFELRPKYEGVYKSIVIDKRHLTALEKGGWQQVSTNESDYAKVADLYRQNEIRTAGLEYFEIAGPEKIILEDTFIFSMYEIYEKIYNVLFRNYFWLISGFAVFCYSLIRIIKSKFADDDALIYFLLGLIYGTKALMVSLVESSLERYSFPVEFVLYLSIPFLVIFIFKTKKKDINDPVLSSVH